MYQAKSDVCHHEDYTCVNSCNAMGYQHCTRPIQKHTHLSERQVGDRDILELDVEFSGTLEQVLTDTRRDLEKCSQPNALVPRAMHAGDLPLHAV